MLIGVAAFAQTKTVTGKVTDERGDALPGATLVVSGTNAYAITDVDGAFSVSAKSGAVVTVSYLGYDDGSFTVGDATQYNIQLNPSEATLLKESVAIGYGTTTKKEVTGSVVSLKAEDFDKGSFTSAAGMLQGKVAGLSVTNPNGGDPTASYEILLRGTNTLSAGQGPLIIIDGVVGADIRSINFQEVESIDVLKDGSAAAIYGTRGTNGVILAKLKENFEIVSVEPFEDLGNGNKCGSIVELSEAVSQRKLGEILKEMFGCEYVRMNRYGRKLVRRIAFCSGSGGSMLGLAAEKRCDALITGDVKHDVWIDANNRSIALFDCGHFHTENPVLWEFRRALESNFPQLDVEIAEKSLDPCEYV